MTGNLSQSNQKRYSTPTIQKANDSKAVKLPALTREHRAVDDTRWLKLVTFKIEIDVLISN